MTSRSAALALAIVLASGAAHAQVPARTPADEGKALVEALGFGKAGFTSANRFGTGLTLSGLKATAMAGGGPDGVPVTARSVRVEGGKDTEEGRSYALVTFDGVEADGTTLETTVFGDVLLQSNGKARYSSVQARGMRRPSKEGEVFAIDGLRMTGSDWRDGLATKGGLQVRGISVTGGRAMMGAALMPDLPKSADLDAEWAFDPDAGRVALKDVSLWYGKAALLRGSFAMSGIDAKRIASMNAQDRPVGKPTPEDQAKAADMVSGVLLEGLALRLENSGLVQSLLSAKALIDGSTPEKLRGDLVKLVEAMWPAKTGDPALRGQTIKAVRAFLADPRSLTLRMAPAPGGVNVMQAVTDASGKGGTTAFGITVEANTPERRAAAAP